MKEPIRINWYPNDIFAEHNMFRHVRILVKEQKSLSGGADELKKELEKTSSDVKEIFTDNKLKDIKSEDLPNRTSKLVKADTIYGIALPLPNELSDSQSHQWNSTTGFVADTAETIGNALPGSIGSLKKGFTQVASRSGFRQPLIDPGYFQEYKGTEPREFNFNWDFVPNSSEEASNIYDIIYNLKKYTLPKTGINGIALLSPYLFEIQVGNPYINALLNINNVVCKNMTVNYSAENALQMFADGMPKYITLQMSFAERALVTSDLY